jgi:hypothetical protein
MFDVFVKSNSMTLKQQGKSCEAERHVWQELAAGWVQY